MKNSVASTHKAKILAKRLLRLHKELPSWRDISDYFYPGVNYATLNRIAKSNGKWIPKSEHIQELLGIAKKPYVKKIVPLLGSSGWEDIFFKKIKPNKKVR